MFTEAKGIAAGVVLVLLLVGFGGLYVWGSGWKTKYTTLQSQDLAKTVADQKAVITDLQDQIKTRDATLANNKQVMNDLSKKHAEDAANLGASGELVNRLLNDAAQTRSRSSPVPEADSGRTANATAVDSGDERLSDLLVHVAAEYWQHVSDCTALQNQIAPQL